MARYRSIRDLDWPLLAITLTICALGVLQIYSATHDTHWRDAWWKQILWVGIAIGIMWVVTSIDYHFAAGPGSYSLRVVHRGASSLQFAFGKLVLAPSRWIRILGFNLQISEIRQIGDNISRSAIPVGAEDGRDEASRLTEIRSVSWNSDRAGDVPAGFGYGFNLSAHSRVRSSAGWSSMEPFRGNPAGRRAGAADGLVRPEGLSKSAIGEFYQSGARIRAVPAIR